MNENKDTRGAATLSADGTLTGITPAELADKMYRALFAAIEDQYDVLITVKGYTVVEKEKTA